MNLTATAPPPLAARLPGPADRWWGLPLIAAMRRDYLGYCLRLKEQHGDLVATRLFRERALDLFHPDHVREALVDHADALIRWERGPEVFAQLMGQSVLVTEGATWQRQRRTLQAAFTPRKVAGYAALMAEATAQGIAQLQACTPSQAVIDPAAWFTRVTMDVILRTLFGRADHADSEQRTERTADAVRVVSAAALREMFWPATLPDFLPLPGKRAKRRALRELRTLIDERIAAHRPGDDDLLTMLLALRDEVTGAPLDTAEVFAQCMVSFQAGHETSATALLWWSLLMARDPAALRRAQAEVDAVLAGTTPDAQALSALPFVVATLKEAMRLYPPVAGLLTRRTTRPIVVGGHAVPERTLLRLTPWVLHHDARWFEAPEHFRPERFLPDAPPPPRGAYLPFGAGPRVCLGQHFAMLEMTIVASMLLQRFEFEAPGRTPMPDATLHVTLRPARAVTLRIRRRRL